MVDINKIRKGNILITEEMMFGQMRLLYGPVFLIDNENNEVTIRLGEELRSFPVERLWTIPAFMVHKTAEPKVLITPGTKVLAGFIATILGGNLERNNANEIVEEIKKKGIQPTRVQEALEVLMSL